MKNLASFIKGVNDVPSEDAEDLEGWWAALKSLVQKLWVCSVGA